MSVGSMLLAHRKSQRLSAEAVGERLGVSRNWIQRLEGGPMELKISQLGKVAKAYGLTELDLLREMAPDQLEAHRRTISNETTLQISPTPEFWEEVAGLRRDLAALSDLVVDLREEIASTRAAAASAARRAGRVEQQLAPLTEQLAMTARDFERAREHEAAYMPSFLEETTDVSEGDRPRAQLRVEDIPES